MIVPRLDIFLIFMLLIRIGGIITLLPIFGGRLVPRQIQLALAGGIAIILYPLFEASVQIPTHVLEFILIAGKEFLIGVLIGFAAKMAFYIAEFAGTLISTETSLMRSDVFDPLMHVNSTTVSTLFFYLVGLIILATDIHYYILDAFVLSY